MRCSCLVLAVVAALAVVIGPHAGVVQTASRPVVTLGSTYAQWGHVLGKRMPTTSTDLAGWHACPNHTTAQLLVVFIGGRAMSISGNRCDRPFPLSQRQVDAQRYMPPDARLHGHRGTQHGAVPVYASMVVAHALPAEVFQNCDQNPVKRGLFVLDTHAYQDTGWVIATGTCTPDEQPH